MWFIFFVLIKRITNCMLAIISTKRILEMCKNEEFELVYSEWNGARFLPRSDIEMLFNKNPRLD